MTRSEIADLIFSRLNLDSAKLAEEFRGPRAIQTCVVDDLLPAELAQQIGRMFPSAQEMREQRTLREYKFTAKQLDEFAPIIKEITFAFQQSSVLKQVESITGLTDLRPDPNLYAGGITLMTQDGFLLPHLDNSHDKDRQLYRVLNLLYYVTPEWTQEKGGNLELWDRGPKHHPREIVSRFNRLVIMATHQRSWHSVTKVVSGDARACISNYYFSATPLAGHQYFHVTSFRGRPEQPGKDIVLRVDSLIRNAVRRFFPKGVRKPEIYRAKS